MPKIILHIGLNKTGTSSLQDFLSLNRDLLMNHGICYPKSASDGVAHHPLSAWIKHQGNNVDFNDPFTVNLFNEIKESRLAIFSSEDLHTIKNVSKLSSLFSNFEVKVVLYVREHVGYLASWYQQDVQASQLSCGFGTYCALKLKPLNVIAGRWVEAFGRENVDVRLYDRSQLVSGDIVADFMSLIGVTDISKFQRKPYENNPSVSGNLLFIKRVFNNFAQKEEAAGCASELTDLSKLDESFRGRMHVPADLVSYVVGKYKSDRKKLLDSYGIRMVELSGDYMGSLTPNHETLKSHWQHVMQVSHDRKYILGRASRYFSLLSGTWAED